MPFDNHEFDPDDAQKDCMKSITDWYKKSDEQEFYMAGYAGTGKSTLAYHVLDELGLNPDDKNHLMSGSYTGQATKIMRRKGLQNSSTIHRMIYIPYEDKDGNVKFRFNHDSELRYTKLILLDEISMVNEEIAQHIRSFGKKILVLGDPGQLRPVQGEGAFTKKKPNFFLSNPHRFAQDSPIIKLSMMARNKQVIPLGDYSEDVRVIDANAAEFEDLLKADQVITGMNKTRRVLNREINNALGYTATYPTESGVKVICLRNNHEIGILNGMIGWTVADKCYMSKNKKFFVQSIVDEDKNFYENLEISSGYFNDYENERTEDEIKRDNRSHHALFDFGSAITSYKSQSSQWDNVLFWDDRFAHWNRQLKAEHEYTTITRAAKKLTIIRT